MRSLLQDLAARRVVAALCLLAVVALVGGYGVAKRTQPHAAKVDLGPRTSEHPSKLVFVHVAGAVRRPGLYRLHDGARVYDAVRAAGGPAKDADLDSVNLAAKVKDGDKVLIPHKGTETSGDGGPAAPQSALVNINTATAAQLDALPGIGPALAERIIDYRTQHGGFRTVDDLQNVAGIGPRKFEDLRSLVTV